MVETTQYNGIGLLDGTLQDLSVNLTLNEGLLRGSSLSLASLGSNSLVDTRVQTTQRRDVSVETFVVKGDTSGSDLRINGVSIAASTTATAQSNTVFAKAEVINAQTASTGVTAEVLSTSLQLAQTIAADADGGQIRVNGTVISFGALQANDADSTLQNAINAQSATTGVTATFGSDGLVLTQAAGGELSVVNESGQTLGTTGNSATLTGQARLRISSDLGFTVDGSGASAFGLTSSAIYGSTTPSSAAEISVVYETDGSTSPVSNLTINGVSISGFVDDGVSSVDGDLSAVAVSNAINAQTATTGVTASVVDTQLVVGSITADDGGFVGLGVERGQLIRMTDMTDMRLAVRLGVTDVVQAPSTADKQAAYDAAYAVAVASGSADPVKDAVQSATSSIAEDMFSDVVDAIVDGVVSGVTHMTVSPSQEAALRSYIEGLESNFYTQIVNIAGNTAASDPSDPVAAIDSGLDRFIALGDRWTRVGASNAGIDIIDPVETLSRINSGQDLVTASVDGSGNLVLTADDPNNHIEFQLWRGTVDPYGLAMADFGVSQMVSGTGSVTLGDAGYLGFGHVRITVVEDRIDVGAIQANDADGALRAAINAQTATTGISAHLSASNELILSAEDGRNISFMQGLAASYAGLAYDTGNPDTEIGEKQTTGRIVLSSDNAIHLASDSAEAFGTGTVSADAITRATSNTTVSTGLDATNLLSASSAARALEVVDSALDQVFNQRLLTRQQQGTLERAWVSSPVRPTSSKRPYKRSRRRRAASGLRPAPQSPSSRSGLHCGGSRIFPSPERNPANR